jgi:hypothetical protein
MIRAKLREHRSFKVVPYGPPGIGVKKVQEIGFQKSISPGGAEK